MFGTSLRPEAALGGTLDIEALAARIPANHTVKGLFCSRFVERLGMDYAKLEPRLSAAPRGGRYLPFKDYLQADYTRIVAAAATKLFPSQPLPEAIRRIARDDFTTFGASMFGKIVLSLIGDARSTLHRAPDAYHRIAPGPRVQVEDLDARVTRLTFEGHRSSLEYTLGQLEGIVLAYQRVPTVIVSRISSDTLAFDVVHGG
jgi:uncharacterized protein (TIGR02265 family)